MSVLVVDLSRAQSFLDSPFLQPVSHKYPVEEEVEMRKMVIDRDDNVYALTDRDIDPESMK